ncbi:MAG: DUF2959 domain-containing protein [Gammaproteobacteria bacterium HGW-Gammaproteobacteria-3]|nr:MAG: DUF2959 domain-containing protein [Gammaproteobacteria bacterium HGW-Gammaproteobacteria-3]
MLNKSLSQSVFNLFRQFFSKKLRGAYYYAKETLGEPKRNIVVHHVSQACESLEETKVHFEGALQRFKTIVIIDDTSLEYKYKLLQQQYDFCKARADNVGNRIRAIEEVSDALFAEWASELNEYSNNALKSRSRQQLKLSRQHYARLVKSMRRAESKVLPVLAAFKDQVLFLKHNLNAQAIAALEHEFIEISADLSLLIKVMEQTILEANQFVASLIEPKTLPNPGRN